MGKTPKPLRILVTDPTMADWVEIRALQEQGHDVERLDLIGWNDARVVPHDIVIGPQCWRMDDSLRPFLDIAIKEARARAYPGKAQHSAPSGDAAPSQRAAE